MKSIIKRITLIFASAGLLLMPALMPITVYAQATESQEALCDGGNLTAPGSSGSGTCANINDEAADTVTYTVNLAINIFSWIVGVASVLMIMVGGLMYITSGGDSGKVGKAKDTILYAIIGLVVVAIAQVIVKFVLGNAVK